METALIVEDDPDQAEMAASFLRLRQIEPRMAFDGRSGVDCVRIHRPDFVLLDLMLPDIDGFEVCRQIRSAPETMSLPIIMVTALHGDSHRRLGFRVGANSYLTKPYGPSDLYQAIDQALSWQGKADRERIRGEIQIELDSAPKFLRQVNDFLVGLYRATPLTIEQVQHLQQAVLEIGQNAIEWGNRMQVDLPVEISYRVFEDRVEICIRDQGSGFDQAMLPHAACRDNPLAHLEVRQRMGLREGGFGLLIARGMLDELRHNEAGNEVTLTKRFPPDAVPDHCAGQEA